MTSNRPVPLPLRVLRSLGALLAVVALVSSCGAIEDMTAPSDWDPLPLDDIMRSAINAEPTSDDAPPGQLVELGWPADIAAPGFVESSRPSLVTSPDGSLVIQMSTKDKVDEDELEAYVALLYENGYQLVTSASLGDWLRRSESEWIVLRNDIPQMDGRATGLTVVFTNQDPTGRFGTG